MIKLIKGKLKPSNLAKQINSKIMSKVASKETAGVLGKDTYKEIKGGCI
jgi:hypothetical protein